MSARTPRPGLLVLASAAFSAFFAFAAFAQTGPTPTITAGPTVPDAEITETSATVRWMTDIESTTVVEYGTTSAFGNELKKIVPIEETETTEISHSMTIWGLEADTTYFAQAKSSAAGGGTATSGIIQFHTKAKPACDADTWSCGEWGACDPDKKTQARACTMTADCPTATTPSPATTQACTPACTADEWSCDAWAACDADGSQTRTCTLKTDCPGVTTPKPDVTQSCTPSCKEDVWDCKDWAACDATKKTPTRVCTLKTDCPGVTTPKPETTQACTPACTADEWSCDDWGTCSADGVATRVCTLKTDCPGVTTPKPDVTEKCAPPPPPTDTNQAPPVNAPPTGQTPDTNAPPPPGGTGSGAPPPPDPSFTQPLVGATGDEIKALSDECAAAGIKPERCAAWLETKYADRSCEAQGIFTADACEKFLTDKNGGTFPGCEGKTAAECAVIKLRALLGYLPADQKTWLDGLLTTRPAAEVFDDLGDAAPSLLATNPDKQDDVRWWPSTYVEGAETSPGFIVFDHDKDGLPDDLEKRLGTDPATPDVTGAGGAPDAKLTREVLKSFFEKADKPTETIYVAVDTDGDGAVDTLIDDRKLLGLKTYDPAKAYLVGDTAVYNGALRELKIPVLPAGTLGAGPPKAVDLDGDGKGDAKVSRQILKAFFEYGAAPTQDGTKPSGQQFASLIDSMLNTVDDRFLRGLPIGQPLGGGEVDPAFSVGLSGGGGSSAPSTGGNVLSGQADPDSTVLIYIYSYVPMVLSTTTDADGNYTYDLQDDVVDGAHTAYVAVTDDTGKIAKKSSPLSIFVKGALAATSEADFLKPDVNVQPTAGVVADYTRYYLLGAAALVVVALGFAWSFSRKMGKTPGAPPPAAPAPPQAPAK
jgi:hypothetical protein